MIAGCSNGVEPLYALTYKKEVSLGIFNYVNDVLAKKLKAAGLDVDSIMDYITANGGTLADSSDVPPTIKDSFRTAMDINWADHVIAQAVCQDWIGNSISKTINMPNSARMQDVKAAYVLSHAMGLKGVTIYRDGSRETQVLSGGNGSVSEPTQACAGLVNERLLPGDRKFVDPIFGRDKNRCECGETMDCHGGCHTCPDCGISSCPSA